MMGYEFTGQHARFSALAAAMTFVAIAREVSAYRLQRWLWLAVSATILVALATTIVGY